MTDSTRISWPIGGRLDAILAVPGARQRLWDLACSAARLHGRRLSDAARIQLSLLANDCVRVTADDEVVVVVRAADLSAPIH